VKTSLLRNGTSHVVEGLEPIAKTADALELISACIGAVKSALHRGRGRLERADRDTPVAGPAHSRELVERFVKALGAKDIEGLRAICSADLCVELVGGAEAESLERNKTFFLHAHIVMP
jgi:hypothetical protein